MFVKLKEVIGNGIDYNDEECTICLETIENAVITTCGHLFCRSCIDQHITNNNSCPICQRPISTNLLISIPKNNDVGKQENQSMDWASSTKIDTLMQGLISETTEKSIVFSQWTSMLDLVEIPLKKKWNQIC